MQLKISVLRRFEPSEVFKELPVTPVGDLPACEYYEDGQEFIIERNEMPEGFYSAAWSAINPSIKTLLDGGDYHWIEEKGVLVTCCLDGLRPVRARACALFSNSIPPDVTAVAADKRLIRATRRHDARARATVNES